MYCQYLISVNYYILNDVIIDDVISVVIIYYHCHCVALFIAYTIEASLIDCCIYYDNFFNRCMCCYSNTFSYVVIVVYKSYYCCSTKDSCLLTLLLLLYHTHYSSLHNLVSFLSYTISIAHCVSFVNLYLYLLLL